MAVDLTPADTSQASGILSGNPDTMGPLPPTGIDPGQASDNAPTYTPATDPLASIDPGQASDNAPTYTPASQDPEVQTGAVHQSELAKIMHNIASFLGGDKTYKSTLQPDGTIKTSLDPSTTKEMWSRVAAEALGGAAKGLAVGQGPGGGARATAAGIQSGLDFKQNQVDAANKDAEAQQNIQMKNAQNALLNVQLTKASFDVSHMSRDDQQAQADRAKKNELELHGQGFHPLMTHVKDGKTIAQYGIANPQVVGMHMGTNGDMIYNEPDGEGGVNIYSLSAEAANSPTTKPTSLEMWSTDPSDQTKIVKNPLTIPAGTKNGDLASKMMALNLNNLNVSKAANQAKIDQENADTKKTEATNTASKLPSEIAANKARANEANAAAAMNNAKRLVLQGGAGGKPGASGLTGEDYLKASGIDEGAWNLIRSTANGDTKRPTMSRSPANQAFLQAVMNYDPTFTDARYDAKQNFKNKGDATSVQGLSTSLAHLDEATQDSAKLGFSPSLASGYTLSGPAADYNQDLKLFTQEAGKLVANKALTQGEYEDLKKGMDSPVQSIRDAAIEKTTTLMGGRVRALAQKYKNATGHEMPMDMFDADTQGRLQKYGILNTQQGATQPPTQPTAQQTAPPQAGIPARPQNVTPQAKYVRSSLDGNHYWIEPGQMAAALKADPKLQVMGQ